ncbi:MAG: hypothetical protein Q4D13_07520 [Erysipelotrichaceae bacterium]|nr:hypothetical protein [Erysipelotrichaceae bacterium]
MNKATIIILIIIAAAFLSSFIRKAFLDRLSRQLYDAAYIKKDKELFEILIGSPQAQLTMSDVSRKIMSLNFYVNIDDENKVLETSKYLIGKKLNMKEAQTVYPLTIGYLCEKGNSKVVNILNDLKKKYANTKEINMMLLMYDCELTYDIYIKKDTGRIKDLEELIKTDLNPQNLAVYQYRLAKLYYYDNNKEKAIQLLNAAKNNTNDKGAVNKIDKILKGNWSLL